MSGSWTMSVIEKNKRTFEVKSHAVHTIYKANPLALCYTRYGL